MIFVFGIRRTLALQVRLLQRQNMNRSKMTATKQEGITSMKEDYSQWYVDVISNADMVDQSPVKGCMVIKPWAMSIWEATRDELDKRIKETGAENAYFPLLIPQSFLSREAAHVDGFAKECAVVTHHRLSLVENENADGSKEQMIVPDPAAKLEEPLIVRPTSETMIWHMFGKWIDSYRSLPLKINQWANVMRWEMRTRPFLRSAEFLWQEGHTAHATREEAEACAKEMLDIYADVVAKLLAIPVIKGAKSPTERFAGAEDTLTIEALMPNGWALQSGTSHFLGQNFAKAFDVTFQTSDGKSRDYVWATSWGVSTRLLGALVMTHSDDFGLVLPPRLAPIQLVIIPVAANKDPDAIHALLLPLIHAFKAKNIRIKLDDRPNLRPGAKFFEWEKKGVPLRLEIGPRDAKNNQCIIARRFGAFPHDDDDTQPLTKNIFSLDAGPEAFADEMVQLLESMQSELFQAAQTKLYHNTHRIDSYEDMKAKLLAAPSNNDENHSGDTDGDIPGFFLVPWYDDAENEALIKADCKATIRCFPFDSQHLAEGLNCFYSGRPATHMAIFARAF